MQTNIDMQKERKVMNENQKILNKKDFICKSSELLQWFLIGAKTCFMFMSFGMGRIIFSKGFRQ